MVKALSTGNGAWAVKISPSKKKNGQEGAAKSADWRIEIQKSTSWIRNEV